jgi:hypothetical protein
MKNPKSTLHKLAAAAKARSQSNRANAPKFQPARNASRAAASAMASFRDEIPYMPVNIDAYIFYSLTIIFWL